MDTKHSDFNYISGVFDLANRNYAKLLVLAIQRAEPEEIRRAILEYAKDLMFYDEAFRIMHPQFELPDLDIEFPKDLFE